PTDTPHPTLDQLTAIFSDLSGTDPDRLDPAATFLELGFDSLFMTQATGAVSDRFGVTLSFRQLFEQAPTLADLAEHLDHRLAAEPPAADGPRPGANGHPANGLAPVARRADSVDQARAPTSSEVGDPRERTDDVEPSSGSGPWRPIDTGSRSLTPAQSAAIAELVDRLTATSPGSKRYTAEHRSRLADPRSVAGFRLPWKELVYPVVADRSSGSRIWDVDGNEYLDIAMGFGVNLFGHAPPFVVEAVQEQLQRGFEIGPQTPLAGPVADLIAELTGHERVAFCNTGSEAVLAAMRLARTISGRTRIVTFNNDYHGLFDEVLARGVTIDGQRRSLPVAPGIPPSRSDELIVLDYGDPAALDVIEQLGPDLAAVLVEPVQSRHPTLQPVDFLNRLRRLTTASDTALIFDEMITGFRSHPGGVQELFGVRADLATYGKVIGGGFPIGVVAGRADYLDALDGGHWRYGDESLPETDVTWFAGTFVRHPVALAAAKATLEHLRAAGPALQEGLNARTTGLVDRLNGFLDEVGAPMSIEHFSSLFLTRFHAGNEFASLFYFHLRDQGIHVTEGRGAFLSTAHTDDDLDQLERAYRAAVEQMLAAGFLPTATQPIGAQARPATKQAQPGSAAGDHELPLTPGQQEIWLAVQRGPEASRAYNLANTIELSGPLDVDLLGRCLQ
ncbi:MAG: aminotransferase class III-fold pyridoxal phosphate-dependent enzyme, partial [Actinomycetota bacterium]